MSDDKTVKTIDPTEAIAAAKEVAVEVKDEQKEVVAEANTEAASTTAQPVVVQKPKIIETKINATKQAVSTAPKPAELPRAQKFMKDYIERYLTINDGLLDSEAKKRQAIDAFKKICTHAVANANDSVVLDMVLDMFKKQRSFVLSEELALQGLQSSDKSEQMRVSVFYRLFYDYSNPKRKKGSVANMDQVRSIFGNDDLVNYLARKFK